MSNVSEMQKKLVAYLEESNNWKAATAIEISIDAGIFYKILGYTRADWATRKYLDVKDEKHVDEIMNILETALEEVRKQLLGYLKEGNYLLAAQIVQFDVEHGDFGTILGLSREDWLSLGVTDERHVDEIMNILAPGSKRSFPILSARHPIDKLLHDAFIGEYKGENRVADLRRDILSCYDAWSSSSPDDIYSPYLVIVQSSGSGKTRLVEQLSLEAWVVYICFPRDGSIGYPWPSPSGVTDWLLKASDTQWQAFFRAATIVVNYLAFGKRSCLPNAMKMPSSDEDETENDLIVKQKVIEVLKTTPGSMQSNFFFRRLVVARSSGDQPDFADCFWQVVFDIVDNVQLTTSDWIDWGHADFPLVFAFDEARALLPREDRKTMTIRTPLRHLQKSFAMDNRRSFGLLIDISPKIAGFAPPSGTDVYGRERPDEPKLFPPFIFVPPMDCLFDKLPQCLNDVCSPEHLLKLGRPLWTKGAYDKPVDIVSLAYTKLGYDERGRDGYTMAISLLAPRVQFLLRSTVKCANDLVWNLAVLLKMSPNRSQLKVRYCSEPAMVAASFQRMENSQGVYLALHYILNLINDNQINTDDIGEFVARFILIWSWDQLVGKGHRSLETLYKPQSVEAFLSAFLGKQAVETVKSLKPEFCSIFNSLMLLTHFAPCYLQNNKEKKKETIFNANLLLDLIYRGAGGCFLGDQDAVDLILPFVVGNEETDLLLKNVSCIVLQVRHHYGKVTSDKVATSHGDLLAYLKTIGLSHPAISILFVLNADKEADLTADWKNDGYFSIFIRGLKQLPIFSNYSDIGDKLSGCASVIFEEIEPKRTARLSISYVSEKLRTVQNKT